MSSRTPLTRAESLADELESDIRSRRFRSGEHIGTMDDLREQTGYGRSTVSEAVRILRDRGAIEIRPGRNGGLFASAPDPVVRVRHTLLTVRAEPSTVADALIVREALEEVVDLDAARHRSRADITALNKLITTMRNATGNRDKFMRANWALHERIGEITPNKVLKGVYVGTVRCVAELSTRAEPDDEPNNDSYLRERLTIHVELVTAIAAQDLERTQKAVRRHAGTRPVSR